MKLLSLIESVKLHEGEERSIIRNGCVEKLVDEFSGRENQFANKEDFEYAIYQALEDLDVEDCVDPDMEVGGQRIGDFASGRAIDVISSGDVIYDVMQHMDLEQIGEGITSKHSYDPVKPGGQSSPRKPVPVKGQKVKLDNEVYKVTHVSADKKTFDVVNVKDDSERHIDVKVDRNPFFIESSTTISEVVSDKDAELIIKQIIKTHGPRNLESVFRDYFPKMSDAEVDNFLKNYKKSNLTLIKNEDVEDNGMIGKPDEYYDEEERREAFNDLQDALQGNYMDDYIKDGACPACGGNGYMDGEEEVYNDETEEYEEGTECDGFGRYGCDEGEMTYGNDSPNWVEIIKHDERKAERQKAKDEYPGDEAVIDFAASTAKQLKRSDQDPRDTMEYVRREYPHLGRAQRASLVAKGMKQAGLTNEGQRCWKGYEKKGTKMMFGKRVNNCVKKEGRIEDTFDTKRIDKHDRPEKKKKKDMKEMNEFIRAGDELMIETSDGEGIVVPVLHVVDENILVGWDNLAEEIVTEHALQLEELRRLAGIEESEIPEVDDMQRWLAISEQYQLDENMLSKIQSMGAAGVGFFQKLGSLVKFLVFNVDKQLAAGMKGGITRVLANLSDALKQFFTKASDFTNSFAVDMSGASDDAVNRLDTYKQEMEQELIKFRNYLDKNGRIPIIIDFLENDLDNFLKRLVKGSERGMTSTPPEKGMTKQPPETGIGEALSADMQNMFDELRIDDNTNIMDGNKELTLDEVGPGFYSLGFDRDGSCFEMSKISKESAKDSITGYGEYKVSDADITDFDGARYYYNENMPDSGVLNIKKATNEAEYRGRKVKLNKPTRGDVKKFKVYVKDPKSGNIKKVNFGHGGSSAKKAGQKTMKIKKSNPKRRKSFRARHNCDNPGPKTKARYWSCRAW